MTRKQVCSPFYAGVMFIRRKNLVAFACLMLCKLAFSESEVPPFVHLDWGKRVYSVLTPKPFGKVLFEMTTNDKKEITFIGVTVNGEKVNIESSLFTELASPGEVEFSYSNPAFIESKNIEYITFTFQVGEPYRIRLGNDIPGCDAPCWQTERDAIQFHVFQDLSVKREKTDFRDYDQKT